MMNSVYRVLFFEIVMDKIKMRAEIAVIASAVRGCKRFAYSNSKPDFYLFNICMMHKRMRVTGLSEIAGYREEDSGFPRPPFDRHRAIRIRF